MNSMNLSTMPQHEILNLSKSERISYLMTADYSRETLEATFKNEPIYIINSLDVIKNVQKFKKLKQRKQNKLFVSHRTLIRKLQNSFFMSQDETIDAQIQKYVNEITEKRKLVDTSFQFINGLVNFVICDSIIEQRVSQSSVEIDFFHSSAARIIDMQNQIANKMMK